MTLQLLVGRQVIRSPPFVGVLSFQSGRVQRLLLLRRVVLFDRSAHLFLLVDDADGAVARLIGILRSN